MPADTDIARRPDDLVSREDLARLYERSDLLGLAWLVGHFALICAGGWLVWQAFLTGTGWLFIAALLMNSVIIGFLFSPLHECAHSTAFRSRWLNEAALWLVAIVYVVPPYFFRYFHLGHHRFTQVKGKDPSLVLPEPATFRQYLWYCAGLWFWWRNLLWIGRHALGRVSPAAKHYVPAGRLSILVLEARLLLGLYLLLAIAAVAAGFAEIVLLCWLLPRLLGEPAQRMLRVAEHVGCEESANLLANTRTTLTNPLISALAWQMPYHAEHHLYPNVPFHKLAAVHRRTAHAVVVERRGYIAGQADIIRWLWSRPRSTGSVETNAAPPPVL